MEWINIETRLPDVPEDKNYADEDIIGAVFCETWKPQTKSLPLSWDTELVRGVKKSRFKFCGSLLLPQWKVTHWMSLPEPPKN